MTGNLRGIISAGSGYPAPGMAYCNNVIALIVSICFVVGFHIPVIWIPVIPAGMTGNLRGIISAGSGYPAPGMAYCNNVIALIVSICFVVGFHIPVIWIPAIPAGMTRNSRIVIPAGSGYPVPGMAYCNNVIALIVSICFVLCGSHPCDLDSGNPCRNDG